MNLVFKNMNEVGDPSDEHLYKDVRVNKGTLFGLDFSNRGMLLNYDLSKGITDLADDAPLRENISTFPTFGTSLTGEIPALTDKRGLPLTYAGGASSMYTSGVRVKGVGAYLFENRPRALFIFWLGWVAETVGTLETTRGIRLAQSTGVSSNFAITANVGSALGSNIVTASIAGKSTTGSISVNGASASQIAMEYRGEDTPNRYWVNGVLQGEGSVANGTFESPVGDDILAIGGILSGATFTNNGIIYSTFLHDLDAAGASAEALVEQDYNYVNELGEFEGLSTRRPYANLAVTP